MIDAGIKVISVKFFAERMRGVAVQALYYGLYIRGDRVKSFQNPFQMDSCDEQEQGEG
jgi:hypothetical protein